MDVVIRLARADEILRIHEIEGEAGKMFSGLGLIDEALDGSFPLEELERLVEIRQVWVSCIEKMPVGMAITSVRDGSAYLEEMDVLPEHGRRGIGGRLLETVCTWARENRHSAVTLSTFRDVPWNGPFYRKHGFKDLNPEELLPWMLAIREKEADHGLAVEKRVFMRRDMRGQA
jgi:GNAT superfamily N-acetyltransferase